MKKNLWIISLGGSRIIPDEVDTRFLEDFKKLLLKFPKKKFVVVTGGGTTARNYIGALRKMEKNSREQALAGIAVTRLHAHFLMRLFGKPANEDLPMNMKKVKNLLLKNQVVFCGALRYRKNNTSDGTAAHLAAYLRAPFINLTNVSGLYNKNPKKHKNARLIKKITWKKFDTIISKIRFSAGQHFVLDQTGAKVILEEKIPTYIVGSLQDIEKILTNKPFKGTLIQE